LPEVRELVAKVLESDFKCSARTEDYPSVVRQIARFAGLRLKVMPRAHQTRRYRVQVTWKGQPGVVAVTDAKYADVRPVTTYLNRLLAETGAERRLYRFVEGAFGSGVVLATAAEANELRRASYLVEPTAAEAALRAALLAVDVEGAAAILREGDLQELDDAIQELGSAAATRVHLVRALGLLDQQRVHHLALFVVAAWAEAGLDAADLPLAGSVPVSAVSGPSLAPAEAEQLMTTWRDLVLRSPSMMVTGGLVDLQYALILAKRWPVVRRVFDLIIERGDLDLSVYCNALYACERDTTGLPIDRAFDERILRRCLPHAEKNPAIYNNAACVYAELGEAEEVLAMLDKALAHGLHQLVADKRREPQFAALHGDPRFVALWQRATRSLRSRSTAE
jgi:hypothetical protein